MAKILVFHYSAYGHIERWLMPPRKAVSGIAAKLAS